MQPRKYNFVFCTRHSSRLRIPLEHFCSSRLSKAEHLWIGQRNVGTMGRFARLFKKDLENEVDVVGCRCRKFGKNDQSKIFFPFSGCFGHRKLKNHANCYCNEIHVTGYRVCLFTSICFLRHDRCLKQATQFCLIPDVTHISDPKKATLATSKI